MRAQSHILEDDIEELRDLLAQEEDRAENLEKLVSEHIQRAEDAEAHVVNLEEHMQSVEQEISVLRVSLRPSLRHV